MDDQVDHSVAALRPALIQRCRAVRPFAAQRARLAGLAPGRVADLVSAVSELAANTMSHTTGLGTLSMWVAGGEVICQVEDTGQITDVLAGTAWRDPVAPGGGRGLWVVHQVCDLAEIRTGRRALRSGCTCAWTADR